MDIDDLWNLLDTYDSSNIVKQTTKEKHSCDECHSTDIIIDYAKGCKRCKECGTCSGQVFDDKPEWSTYDDGHCEGNTRCSQPTSFFFPKSSMCTGVTGKKGSMIRTLQIWDQMIYHEYTLLTVFTHIECVCGKNYLPKSVIDNTKILFKQIHDKKIIFRGNKKRTGIYGACIYYGCRLQNFYRTPQEIAQILNTTSTVITSGSNRLRTILVDNDLLNALTPVTPLDFIERFCFKLGFNKSEINDICRITRNNNKLFLTSNHQPMSVAASCVILYTEYYKYPMDKQLILDTFNITAITTEKILIKLYPFINFLINDDLTEALTKKLVKSNTIVNPMLLDVLKREKEKITEKHLNDNKDIIDSENIKNRLKIIENNNI